MDDLFSDALDILADSPVGSAGVLTPLSGDPVSVTVIGLREKDPSLGLASPDVSSPGFTCELRRSEYTGQPASLEQASLVTEGHTLRVHSARVTTYTLILDCYAV